MWQQCVYLQTEENLFPLGRDTHSISLIKEPGNRYDPYAIKIGIEFKQETPEEVLPKFFIRKKWQDIGYIPKIISKILNDNLNSIKDGQLINIYSDAPKNIYFARIALFYGKRQEIPQANQFNQRLTAILEE